MKTRHALIRAAQRGIKAADIDLIVHYGTQTSGGLILTQRDLEQAERESKHLICRLSHLVGKFVATDGDVVITVFHATEQQRRAQLGKRGPAEWRRQGHTRGRAHAGHFVRRKPKPPLLPAAGGSNQPLAGDALSLDERDTSHNEAAASFQLGGCSDYLSSNIHSSVSHDRSSVPAAPRGALEEQAKYCRSSFRTEHRLRSAPIL